MAAYYNEIEPFAAQWLRNLIAAGHIAPGDVDTRSIEDVSPDDLHGYDQCHFFAGLGGWSYALRLAEWPDDRPVWTGSCPCQPFSAAGKGGGFADERHLWPAFHWLIAQCHPDVVFGEQVASKDGLAWLDLVQTDLEGTGYACGASDTCSAGVGAPHIRQRLYWVADSLYPRRPAWRAVARDGSAAGCGGADGMANAAHNEQHGSRDTGAQRRSESSDRRQLGVAPDESGTAGFWHPADWLPCIDGKARPVEPGTFPLAHGIPGRVGRLRAYGNAINPWQAKEFIQACFGD